MAPELQGFRFCNPIMERFFPLRRSTPHRPMLCISPFNTGFTVQLYGLLAIALHVANQRVLGSNTSQEKILPGL